MLLACTRHNLWECFLSWAGGNIMTEKKKQPTTFVFSFTKFEYIFTILVAKEAIWLHQLLMDLRFPQPKIMIILLYCLDFNPWFHDCTKYVKIQYHFLWEEFFFELLYCSVEDMWNHVFIEALLKFKHDICYHTIELDIQ